MIDHTDVLAALCTAECGKPISESRGEVAYAGSFVEWFAEEGKRAYGDIIPATHSGNRLLVLKQPVGVAAAITPWNFPLAMITRKAAPALAAGCSIIVKPAEATPLSAVALETLAHKAGIPKGVFQILVTDEPETVGTKLATDPRIAKLSFTGSTRVGKSLLEQCASTVKRVSMELGGNAPFIVFDDADIDAAVEGAIQSKFRNAGQTCVCANRFLVQSSVRDEFADKLARRVRDLKVGDGSEQGIDIGPLISEDAREKVIALVKDAQNQGAKALVGGAALETSRYYAPTVISEITPAMDIAQTEIFGPVAPIIDFKDEADAMQIANDTRYGLAAYFYARDMGRVWRMMEALDYGMVGVNAGVISTEVAPFGGVKESGIGREGSRYGIDEYLELKYAMLGGI